MRPLLDKRKWEEGGEGRGGQFSLKEEIGRPSLSEATRETALPDAEGREKKGGEMEGKREKAAALPPCCRARIRTISRGERIESHLGKGRARIRGRLRVVGT